MPAASLYNRLKHAWNVFKSRDPTENDEQIFGDMSYIRQDKTRRRRSNEQSIVTAVYNRVAIDVAAINIRHVRTDENGFYDEDIKSSLDYCLATEANIDQTSRAFFQDVVMSLFDEGVVAVVPVEASLDPRETGGYEIYQLRTGKILEWYPRHVLVSVYDDRTGKRRSLKLPKTMVAIIENPLYSVMNEPNSTLQRLIRKLNILDSIDEQSGAGKLDVIIQLPFVIKSEARKQQAEARRKEIEMQLSGSKYGIAYTDGAEKITQLNRAAENNLMGQIQYLTSMLYSQLGITEEVFNGQATEAMMLNYMSRTVEPILSAIVDEFKRKFLTKTARTQHQSIMYFRNIFRLVPANELANVADKYTRNEILSSNEMRAVIGYKPSKDPKADKLANKNLNRPKDDSDGLTTEQMLQLFELLVKNQEEMEEIDPKFKEIVSKATEVIGKRIK